MHDTHAHLDMLLQRQGLLPYNQREVDFSKLSTTQITDSTRVVSELLAEHNWLIQVGVSITNFDLVYNLFNPINKIKFLFGSHPELANEDFEPTKYLRHYQEYIQVNNTFANPRVVGMGEIGLDYYYTNDPEIIAKQHILLEGLLQIASQSKVTPVFHVREAFDDFFPILDNFPSLHGSFLIHCFTGNADYLRAILDRGGRVGYGGIITFGTNADDLRDTVRICPLDGFVLETDLPFLSPTPHRGKDCLPDFVDHVADKISELKSLPKTQIWQSSQTNSHALFPSL